MFPVELARLRADVSKLNAKDQEFALSLLSQHARRGMLSEKQWPWIRTLASRLDAPATATPAAIGDLTELRAMFAKAGEKLKFPHLMLRLSDDQRLKVWLAGPRSMKPDTLSVVLAGAGKEWLGRVDLDGSWKPASRRPADFYASVASILSELLARPQETLSLHGKQLGACCYCNTELTDARSVEMGYGPVCAKKWGLPWGKK